MNANRLPFLLEKLHTTGSGESLGAVARSKLAIDVTGMGLDRADGDEEVTRDLAVGAARSEER
jgi:hypothetical protein